MKLSEIRIIKTIKKYLRLFWLYLRFTLILDTTYRFGFLMELFVEFGYQAVLVLFMQVIFSNIGEVAGWNYYEILFLTGLNILASDIIVGSFGVYNLWALPEKIKNGEIDFALLKPINSLFSLGLARPYITSYISTFTGIFLMIYAAQQLQITILFGNILAGLIILGIGSVIVFCIMCIISSFSF